MRYAIAYLATGASFLLLDGGFLALVGPRLYRPTLDSLLGDGVRPVPAVLFYLLYIGGLTGFCVLPSLHAPWARAVRLSLLRGLMLGLVAYGTYDLTCQAVMRAWSWNITLADLAWGAFASALASGMGALAVERSGARV
jgi:uncharacterized membrane protein